MQTVLITGAAGFIGKNLCEHFRTKEDVEVIEFTRNNSREELTSFVERADFIYHIAGVNRPDDESEFKTVNTDLTEDILKTLRTLGKHTPLLITSSTQAELENPYGKSKFEAENLVLNWADETESPVYIYRLPGVFGKWCKPNYNSVVATFCYNIAHDSPIQVSDEDHSITLTYIDDVVEAFAKHLTTESPVDKDRYYAVDRTFQLTLGELRDKITALHDIRDTLVIPNLEDVFNKFLYATYISYFDTDKFSYTLQQNIDNRGWLAEFVKSKQFGQVFISKTKPGVSRGDHWHNTKIEKFLVVEGEGEVTFRNKINDQDIIRYKVNGEVPTVVDIPTGYVHAITNIGDTDMITIFWANEILDKDHPDTYYEKVEERA